MKASAYIIANGSVHSVPVEHSNTRWSKPVGRGRSEVCQLASSAVPTVRDEDAAAALSMRISLNHQMGDNGVPEPLYSAMVSSKVGNYASRVKQAQKMYTSIS